MLNLNKILSWKLEEASNLSVCDCAAGVWRVKGVFSHEM